MLVPLLVERDGSRGQARQGNTGEKGLDECFNYRLPCYWTVASISGKERCRLASTMSPEKGLALGVV